MTVLYITLFSLTEDLILGVSSATSSSYRSSTSFLGHRAGLDRHGKSLVVLSSCIFLNCCLHGITFDVHVTYSIPRYVFSFFFRQKGSIRMWGKFHSDSVHFDLSSSPRICFKTESCFVRVLPLLVCTFWWFMYVIVEKRQPGVKMNHMKSCIKTCCK